MPNTNILLEDELPAIQYHWKADDFFTTNIYVTNLPAFYNLTNITYATNMWLSQPYVSNFFTTNIIEIAIWTNSPITWTDKIEIKPDKQMKEVTDGALFLQGVGAVVLTILAIAIILAVIFAIVRIFDIGEKVDNIESNFKQLVEHVRKKDNKKK